jgi:hypothetical protein
METITDARNAAKVLCSLELALCRPDKADKRPTYKGWPTRSLEPDDFAADDSIGVLGGPLSKCGRLSHSLVIIDLDCADAVKNADAFLPVTRMVEGRPSKPRSHRYYLVPNDTIPAWAQSTADQSSAAARAACGHPGPALKHFTHAETEKGILDLIGTGGQVVCPPSLHESGERREWEGGVPGEPAVIDFSDLWDAAQRLAGACGWKPDAYEAPDPPPPPPSNGKSFKVLTWTEPSAFTRAKAWLAKVPGAVSGKGGHDQTYSAAVGLVHGFELSREDALRLLIQDYNPTCQPAWTTKELEHKVEDAATKPHEKPKGWLKNAPMPDANSTIRKNGVSDGNTSANPESETHRKWPAPKPMSALSVGGPAVEWLIKGMVARGHSTLFSSLMKLGKSTLLGHLLRSRQLGTPFAGLATRKGRTLVLSEESETIWALRRDGLGLDDSHHVLSKPILAKPSYADWAEFIEYVADDAAAMDADMVVIDTLSKFAPWRNENDSADVQGTMNPLDRLTKAGLGVLLFHHAGYAAREVGQAARGSTALAAAVDILLELRRMDGAPLSDRRRVVNGVGRFDDVIGEVVLSLNPDGTGYAAEGDKQTVRARELGAAILNILPLDTPGLTADEVHEALPEEVRAKRGDVMKVLKDGGLKWQSAGAGRKGDPFRFWRSAG